MTSGLLRAIAAGSRTAIGRDIRDGLPGDAGRLLLSHLVRLSLGLVTSALIARALGPERLGTLAVVGAAVMIAATVTDFGLTGSAVRRIAALLATGPAAARSAAGVFARLRLASGIAVCATALLLARPAAGLLGLPDGTGPALVRFAGLAILAAAASGAITTLLHAQRRFHSLFLTQVAVSFASVLTIGSLYLLDRLTITTALAAGAAASTAGFGLALALLPREWRAALPRGGFPVAETRPLLAFGRWLWIGAMFSILAAQLDLLLVHRWLDPALVGVYAVAFALALKADLLNQVLHTLLLPAASALTARGEYRDFFRQGLVRGLLLALPLLLLVPLARPFIVTVYGAEYTAAAGVFAALLVVVLFDLLSQPLLLLPFPMALPKLIAAADVARVATLLVSGALLIPTFGLYGAVAARLAARVVGLLVIGIPVALRLAADRPVIDPATGTGIPPAAPSPEGT